MELANLDPFSEEIDPDGYVNLYWEATDEYPSTEVILKISAFVQEWGAIVRIDAEDIAYKGWAGDPDEIIFLKMEE